MFAIIVQRLTELTLGFFWLNIYHCPQDVKEAAYKVLVHPVLEYGSSIWDPQGVVLRKLAKIILQLKWKSLKKRLASYHIRLPNALLLNHWLNMKNNCPRKRIKTWVMSSNSLLISTFVE